MPPIIYKIMDKTRDDTAAAKISRVLAERIISGELAPGTRLRQDHIAAEFNFSHVPVREALRRIESQGLAVSEPRRGVRVASFDLEEITEVAEMRAVLEVLALQKAFPNINETLLRKAEEAAVDCDAASDVRTWEEANRRFHRLIISVCAMPRLLSTIDNLHVVSARFLFAAWQQDWEVRTDSDHRIILDALRDRDIAKASATLRDHVKRIGHARSRTV